MSSDPNKRKHFRYLTVSSVSCRVLFQNLVRILKLYRIASERVTIVVRGTQKYINCEYDSNPLQCNPDIFLNVCLCLCSGIMYSLSWFQHHDTKSVELNM